MYRQSVRNCVEKLGELHGLEAVYVFISHHLLSLAYLSRQVTLPSRRLSVNLADVCIASMFGASEYSLVQHTDARRSVDEKHQRLDFGGQGRARRLQRRRLLHA